MGNSLVLYGRLRGRRVLRWWSRRFEKRPFPRLSRTGRLPFTGFLWASCQSSSTLLKLRALRALSWRGGGEKKKIFSLLKPTGRRGDVAARPGPATSNYSLAPGGEGQGADGAI